jgi:hypothetical protein
MFADFRPVVVGAKVTANLAVPEGPTTPVEGSTVISALLEVTAEMFREPPPEFVTVTVSVVVTLRNRSAKWMLVGATEKLPPTPVPLTAMESGDPAPSCVKTICPVFAPWLVGANVTRNGCTERAGMAADGGFTWNWLELEAAEEIVSAPGPPFETITVSVCVEPTSRLPKATLTGVAVNPVSRPQALRPRIDGDPAALCVKVSVPVWEPALGGVIVTTNRPLADGAIEPPTGATTKSGLLEATDEMSREAVPVFVTVTVSLCVVPTRRLPKAASDLSAEKIGAAGGPAVTLMSSMPTHSSLPTAFVVMTRTCTCG